MGERTRTALLWTLGLVLVGAAVAWVAAGFLGRDARLERLRIATGGEGGSYLPIGRSIARSLEGALEGVDAEVLVTAGSVENMELLRTRQAELAILQDDTPADAAVRTIAPLYDEVLQVVVRDPSGTTLGEVGDLAGRRVAVGAEGSGTARIARQLLGHFGVDAEAATLREIGGPEALAALAAGEVDAVCVMGGLPAPLVRSLLGVPGARLLGLGHDTEPGSTVDGVSHALPHLHGAVIPAATYGAVPARPLGAVAASAVLVAHRDVPEGEVREITRALFADRAALRAAHPVLARLREVAPEVELAYPLHPGAQDHYDRNEPSFFVEYAEPISLAFTLLVALGSAFLAVRQWLRRRKKNRIDTYYEEIAGISADIDASDPEALRTLRVRLLGLRRKAFQELIAERLAADESFSIFQNYVASELALVDARLEGRGR